MKVYLSKLALLISAVSFVTTPEAAILAYESFNYTPGQSLTAQGPAIGFATTWTVNNGTPPLIQAGNPIDNPDGMSVGGAEWAATAYFSNTYGLTNDTYVLSFNENAPSGKLGYFELYDNNNGKLVIGIDTAGQFFIENWGSPGSRQYSGAYSNNSWREVVATINFSTGADTVSLEIFDQTGSQIGTTLTHSSLDFNFNRIRLNAWGGGAGTAYWDEITLEDNTPPNPVAQVPEPSSLLLLSLGAVGLFTVSRRSRRTT